MLDLGVLDLWLVGKTKLVQCTTPLGLVVRYASLVVGCTWRWSVIA